MAMAIKVEKEVKLQIYSQNQKVTRRFMMGTSVKAKYCFFIYLEYFII